MVFSALEFQRPSPLPMILMLHFRVQNYCITKKKACTLRYIHKMATRLRSRTLNLSFIRGQIRVQTWNDSSSVCAREKYTFENGDRAVAHCSTLTCVVDSECLNLA